MVNCWSWLWCWGVKTWPRSSIALLSLHRGQISCPAGPDWTGPEWSGVVCWYEVKTGHSQWWPPSCDSNNQSGSLTTALHINQHPAPPPSPGARPSPPEQHCTSVTVWQCDSVPVWQCDSHGHDYHTSQSAPEHVYRYIWLTVCSTRR